jgi:hypothetical protein
MSKKPKPTGKDAMNERFMMRVDQEFLDALDELRRLEDEWPALPSRAEAIRRAVIGRLELKRREHKGKH